MIQIPEDLWTFEPQQPQASEQFHEYQEFVYQLLVRSTSVPGYLFSTQKQPELKRLTGPVQ